MQYILTRRLEKALYRTSRHIPTMAGSSHSYREVQPFGKKKQTAHSSAYSRTGNEKLRPMVSTLHFDENSSGNTSKSGRPIIPRTLCRSIQPFSRCLRHFMPGIQTNR